MAGQKIYSTNFLTSGRNAVCCTVSATVDASTASKGVTIINGKMFSATNANGVVTLNFPEKFAKCEYIDCSVVDTAKTGNRMVLTTDYDPSKGQAVFSLLSPSQAAVTTGVYKFYATAVFILG